MGKIKSQAVVLIFEKEMVPFELGQSIRRLRRGSQRPDAIKLKIVGTFSPTRLGTMIEQLATLKNGMEAE
ncbi:hypothetical protein [Pedobacter zeae]|uniref:Uncharacterized protein n=1 Tax=Pedobacter zeae TaxID=1737356 RepID=A0A7W6K7N8_9SPHI|nr:hypothetical protein [Pedobacter zeae]MBB4106645.1 hypothetical protein [Pedobacter zeae]GGH02908.1 hypothetical protein GCM10007422_17630 [Pedobacter zeae]